MNSFSKRNKKKNGKKTQNYYQIGNEAEERPN